MKETKKMIQRRQFMRMTALSTFALGTARAQNILGGGAREGASHASRFKTEIIRIEAASGGRLGVAVLDTQDGRRLQHRGDERFPLCSTFKFLAAAHVLARVDRQQEQLDRRIPVRTADLVDYSPVTQPRADRDPMTVEELCAAAMTISDNTAANLLLASMGGPAGLTAYLRKLGDPQTRLDRNEPTLNTGRPGDPRDTTTPAAMLATMQKLVLGEALSPASRGRLTQWLIDNQTGNSRLRAGLPAGWRVGDKTGSGAYGTNNDIGVIWPTGRKPVLVTAYLTGTKEPLTTRERTLADVGRLVASLVAG
jgi:beta-lactamase class A